MAGPAACRTAGRGWRSRSTPFWPLAGTERPPGGESFAEMISGSAPAMERLAGAHAGEDVVAVSHGGAIRAAVAHCLRIGPTTRCTCRSRTCR